MLRQSSSSSSAPRELLLWVSLSRSGELFPPFAAAIQRTRNGRIGFAAVPHVAASAAAIADELEPLLLPRVDLRLKGLFRTLVEFLGAAKQVFTRSRRNSLVHVLMPSPLDLVLLAPAKIRGARVLMTVHDAHLHPGENSRLQRLLYSLAKSYADQYVTVSRFVQSELIATAPGKPVLVVPNGLVEDLGRPAAARVRHANSGLRLLFHGRIRAYKGVDVLLEAMRLIEARRDDITLTIAGDGADEALRTAAGQLRTVRTLFQRTSDEVRAQLYHEADVNVLPYLEASQSGVAQRGLFAALPSIATTVGALPEQLSGENSLMIPPADVTALVVAIEALADQPELYNRLSEGARATAEALHPDITAARWNVLYDAL